MNLEDNEAGKVLEITPEIADGIVSYVVGQASDEGYSVEESNALGCIGEAVRGYGLRLSDAQMQSLVPRVIARFMGEVGLKPPQDYKERLNTLAPGVYRLKSGIPPTVYQKFDDGTWWQKDSTGRIIASGSAAAPIDEFIDELVIVDGADPSDRKMLGSQRTAVSYDAELAGLNKRQITARVLTIEQEQAKREKLLADHALLVAYAADKGISEIEMRELLGSNYLNNAPRLARYREILADRPDDLRASIEWVDLLIDVSGSHQEEQLPPAT